MKKEIKPKTASSLRKEVYDFLRRNHFDLIASLQSELSEILKSVYEHRVVESRKEDDAPVKHEVVCPKCQQIKVFKGRMYHRHIKSIKKAGGEI